METNLLIAAGIVILVGLAFIINFLRINESLERSLAQASESSRKYCKESLDRYDELFKLRAEYVGLENHIKKQETNIKDLLAEIERLNKEVTKLSNSLGAKSAPAPSVTKVETPIPSVETKVQPAIVTKPLKNKRNYKSKNK